MIITHKVQIDLARRGPDQSISVVQDDKYSRNVEITLLCNGVPWAVPEGTTGVVRYRKPDGTGGNYDLLPDGSEAVSADGNVLTVALAPQVCTVPKVVKLAVGLLVTETVDDTAVTREVNTFSVDIDVQENPGLQVTSEGYYNVRGALPDSGWEPNMNLVTDENGKVVARATPIGGLVLSGTVQPGQYLRVTGVDEDGNITVEAVYMYGEVSAYLYNGVRLLALPESELPYALIGCANDTYYLGFSDKLRTVFDNHTCNIGLYNEKYVFDGNNWVSSSTAIIVTAVWANFDVCDASGNLYISASEPIPVYE